MIIYLIIALAIVVRLLSYFTDFAFLPPNFAPISALALYAGVYVVGKRAQILPLVALFLSDIIIGFYDPLVMAAVYGSFLVITLFGRLLQKHLTFVSTVLAALSSSIFFYLVTNFAEWVRPESMYVHTWDDLVTSYIAGIPFFKYTLLGDLVFTGVFFGAHAFALAFMRHRQSTAVPSVGKGQG